MSNRRSYSASQYSGGSKKSKSKSKSYSPPRGGGADMGTVSTPTRKANPTLALNSLIEQRKTDQVNRRIAANKEARAMALTPPKRNLRQKIGGGINRVLNNPFVRTYAAWGTGGLSEKMRQAMGIKSLYDNRNILDDEAIEEEVRNIPVTGGITASPISFNQTPPNQSNIAYDERLGYVDLNTGQPINMAMPGATQAKTFNTAQELMNLGAAEKGWFGPGLTKQGKALDQFIENAKLRQKAGKEQTGQGFYDWATAPARSGLYKGWKKQAPYIEGALKQGVLSETSDYSGQLPFKKGIDLANGGIVNLYKYGGFI